MFDVTQGKLVGNHAELLTTDGLKEKLKGLGCRPDRVALQKFVKCKGKRAFVVRSVWTRGKLPYCFIVTNKVSAIQPGSSRTTTSQSHVRSATS
jgi:hypothetical protein